MSTSFLIDADFPGGNVIVDAVRGDTVDLHQDLRDTDRDWFYWYFRVRGAAGRSVRFNFTASRALGTRGPAVSRDSGRTWQWIGRDSVEGNAFTYRFTTEEEVRFSFAMPYQLADWQRFAAGRPWLRTAELARTRGGRAVPVATVGQGPLNIFIAARHHCCEMMPNYAIEGLIDFFHADPEATWLREHITLTIVPLADLDGVEAGDQGKGRRPRDHGRDYAGTSLYPEIAAIRTWLAQYQPVVVLDLHCPWIAGQYNEHIYLPGTDNAVMAEQQRQFSRVLEGVRRGPLPFRADGYLPFGVAWNTAANFTEGMGLGRYAVSLPGIRLASSIELPYATADGAEVNADSARAFGADLGRALGEYLRGPGSDTLPAL